MDQAPLVESQIKDGQKLLDRLAEEGIAVGGGWVKECDRWLWYLYVVTPLVGVDTGTLPAYGRIGEVIRAMPQPFGINSIEVKVVGPSEPVGKAILDIQRGHVGRWPYHHGGHRLGDVSIDGAYIYPPPVLAAGQ